MYVVIAHVETVHHEMSSIACRKGRTEKPLELKKVAASAVHHVDGYLPAFCALEVVTTEADFC